MERGVYQKPRWRPGVRRRQADDTPTHGNRFDRTRQPIEFGRVLTLSDGVFAIALTLLVLSLEVPPGLKTGELYSELINLSPMLVAFLVSVGIIALFWFSHHEMFAAVQRVDSRLMWMNIGYLGLVVMVPFVQRLQGDYPFEAIVYVLYAAVLALLNFVDLMMHNYVYRADLLRKRWSPRQYRTEMLRGITLTSGFLLSIPLAFVLVSWTIVIWILMLPLDTLVKRWSTGSTPD
jgi:uncharacterized membrane protein